MPASPEREKSLSLFVDGIRDNPSLQNNLNLINDAAGLKSFVDGIDSSITGMALIPLEQATSPPKITVDSGILEAVPFHRACSRSKRCTYTVYAVVSEPSGANHLP